MNIKRIFGLLLLVAGVILVFFTSYERDLFPGGKKVANGAAGVFDSPDPDSLSHKLQQDICGPAPTQGYEPGLPFLMSLSLGTALVIVGAGMTFSCRRP